MAKLGKDDKGQAVWWPRNTKSPGLQDENNEGGFPDNMVMFQSPIAHANRTHRYMAAVVSEATAFRADPYFGGKVVAHELGHCFALRHRWKEKETDDYGNITPGDWADKVTTYSEYQLPRFRACPDDAGMAEDVENLMTTGLDRARDVHKCDMDLLQAVGMRGVPRDAAQWQN